MAISEIDASTSATDETDATKQQRRAFVMAFVRRQQTRAMVVTFVLLAVGIGLVWVTKRVLGIEGDAVFIALLLVPLLVHLAYTDRVANLSLFGASVAFRELRNDVAEVGQSVTEIGQLEPERTAYRGKLAQVATKDRGEFCLLYADIDGLRKRTRYDYMAERTELERHERSERRTEDQIRRSFIDQLEFAFTDGFYEAGIEDAKCDVFRLEEPDLIMIARAVTSKDAMRIAERASELFRERTKGCGVTVSVLPAARVPSDATPEQLDHAAADGLAEAKRSRKGDVHLAS